MLAFGRKVRGVIDLVAVDEITNSYASNDCRLNAVVSSIPYALLLVVYVSGPANK